MYKEKDSSALMDLLYGRKPSNEFKVYETIVKEVTRIKTLIEDDVLLNKIVAYANREGYCKSNKQSITLSDAKNINRRDNLMYYIKDDNYESGYRERWSTSRWEGDYCEPYFAGYEEYSFNEIMEEYITNHPNDVKWKIEEKEKIVNRY